MVERIRLGMLTPSSNTVLEPVTAAILADLPEATAHFARFRVQEISLDDAALGQFDSAAVIAAAELLADARPDVISWCGTSGSWIGFEADEALCRGIEAATSVPASTSSLAFVEALATMGVRRYALVTPYLADVQDRIVATYGKAGFVCVAERHLNDRGNFSFSEIGDATIAGMLREVASAKPEAIIINCTNLRGARIAVELEQELDVPIIDSVIVTVWKSLLMAGVPPGRVRGWGRLFDHGMTAVGARVHG